MCASNVDASNGYQLWSERYEGQLADIFDVQDEIARTIGARLKVAFAAGARLPLERPGRRGDRGARAAVG